MCNQFECFPNLDIKLEWEKRLLKFDVLLSRYKLDHDKLKIIYILLK